MIGVIEEKRAELARLCARYGVQRLDVFGSAAADGRFDAGNSDLDFLVDFHPVEGMDLADQYFGLWEDLQALFRREVDLVMARAMRNPYFIKAVNRTRRPLYAAGAA
jgi:hypothetical protein